MNILDLQPNKVSKSLSSYATLIFGPPKVGKSRLAAEFPKPLFFATEPTQETIPGAYLLPIRKWSEMKQAVRQLKDPKVKEKFSTIVIDVVDLAASYCEEYICSQNDVDALKDIAWGAGYSMTEKEFRKTLYEIRQEGYGLVMLSHVTDGTFTREDGTEFNERTPSIPGKRTKGIVENLADIYGYAHMVRREDGSYERVLSLRATDESMPNGNHFKYMPDEVPLSYKALEEALADAIQKEENETSPDFFCDDKPSAFIESEPLDFSALREEFDSLVAKLQEALGSSFGTQGAPRIVEIANKYLGKGKLVADCTPAQVEQLALIVDDIKDMFANGF